MRTISIAVLLAVLMSGCVDAVDSTSVHGNMEQAASPVSRHVSLPAAAATAKPVALAPTISTTVTIGAAHGNATPGGGFVYVGQAWRVDWGGMMFFPLSIPEGCTIAGWGTHLWRNSPDTNFEATLQFAISGIATTVGDALSDSSPVLGPLTLRSKPLAHVVTPEADYSIRVSATVDGGGDFVFWGRVAYTCQ